MSEKLETKFYRLEKLCKWDRVDEVNEMLLNGVSPHHVSAFCKENGFKISHPKLYEYKDMLQTAIARGITVERLLGIGVPKRTPVNLLALGVSKQIVKNELEVLDAVIQKGFDALSNNPTIRIQDAIRAIELKNKITGGGHGGFTMDGLDELRELEVRKFHAIVKVVTKYLSEDQIEELETEIASAEKAYYEEVAPHLLDEYNKASELADNEIEA